MHCSAVSRLPPGRCVFMADPLQGWCRVIAPLPRHSMHHMPADVLVGLYRFRDNVVVQGEPRIRFFVGAPLVASNGHRLGTLCYLGPQPRVTTAQEAMILANMAGARTRSSAVSSSMSSMHDGQLGSNVPPCTLNHGIQTPFAEHRMHLVPSAQRRTPVCLTSCVEISAARLCPCCRAGRPGAGEGRGAVRHRASGEGRHADGAGDAVHDALGRVLPAAGRRLRRHAAVPRVAGAALQPGAVECELFAGLTHQQCLHAARGCLSDTLAAVLC